ncbi:MAG: hypothetical protein MJE68_10225 [Proteobacteria bacterium]|nr:hypothetical protein [Pseudomonadota bacterium]
MNADQQKKANSLQEKREIAFYQAILSALTTTQMERDKQILILSAGGIGLLTTFRSVDNFFALVLLLFAGTAFAVSIWNMLIILRRNGDYLVSLELHGSQHKTTKALLASLEKRGIRAFRFFLGGVILTSMLFLYSLPMVNSTIKSIVATLWSLL